MRRRLRLPWWLFRLTRPSDRARVDWCSVRWPEQPLWEPAPLYVGEIEHICHPICLCALGLSVDRSVMSSHING